MAVAGQASASHATHATHSAVKWFHTPGFNIECEVAYKDTRGTYAFCQSAKPARSVTLKLDGSAKICQGGQCLGNGPPGAATLTAGQSVTVGTFRCASSGTSIRCSAGAHGFTIGPSGISIH
jgi:hypothetical protein